MNLNGTSEALEETRAPFKRISLLLLRSNHECLYTGSSTVISASKHQSESSLGMLCPSGRTCCLSARPTEGKVNGADER